MNFDIALDPNEVAQLSVAASQVGITPAELLKKLAFEHLPPVSMNYEDKLDATLRHFQQQDDVALMPDIATKTLFAQWANEDAKMTDAERDAEDRLWEDLENGLIVNTVMPSWWRRPSV